MALFKSFAFFTATLFISSCSGSLVRSDSIGRDTSQCTSREIQGAPRPIECSGLGAVSYYLPDRLFTLSFTRAFTETAARNTFLGARAARNEARVALSTLERQLRAAQARLASDPKNVVLQRDVARLKYLVGSARQDVQDADNALTGAAAAFDASRTHENNCGFTDTFVLAPHSYVADTESAFRARLNHRITRNDTLTISTNASGLLTGGNSISADQSSAIAQAIARIAGAGGGLDAAPFAFNRRQSPAIDAPAAGVPCTERSPAAHTTLIDLADRNQLNMFTAALRGSYAYYRLEVSGADGQSTGGHSHTSADTNGDGLFYRRNLPHTLTAYSAEPHGGDNPLVLLLFEMPNSSPTEFIGYPNGPLTESKYTIAFENGMLTSYKAERPSELLAGLNLPLDVVKAFLSVPAELLTLRINNLTKQKELTAMEVEALKQAYFLEQARLGAFPSTAPTAPPPAPDADDGD
jgi:hypothetical protein